MEDRPIQMFTMVEGYHQPVECSVILGPEYLMELERMQRIYENDDLCGYYIIDEVVVAPPSAAAQSPDGAL